MKMKRVAEEDHQCHITDGLYTPEYNTSKSENRKFYGGNNIREREGLTD